MSSRRALLRFWGGSALELTTLPGDAETLYEEAEILGDGVRQGMVQKKKAFRIGGHWFTI